MLMIRSSRIVVVVCAAGIAILVTVLLAVCTPVERRAVLQTGMLAAGVIVLTLPLALLTAVTCLTRGFWSRCLAVTCLCLLFTPMFVQVSAWDSAFGKLGWLINLPQYPGRLISAWAPAIWVHTAAAVPQVAVIAWLSLARGGHRCEDQASLDVNSLRIFWHITLPRIMLLLLAGGVWVMVVCGREIAVTDIYRIGTVAEQIYLGYSLGQFGQGQDSWLADLGIYPALAVILLIASAVMAAICKLADRYPGSGDLQPAPRPTSRMRHALFAMVMLLLLLVVPAISLVARASKSVDLVDGVPMVEYAWNHAVSVVAHAPWRYASEFQWSLGIASVSSAASVLLAIVVGWMACESRRATVWMLLSVAVACSLPGPLIGSTLLDVRDLLQAPVSNWLFDRTIFAPVIANLIFCWPISSLLVWMILRSTSRNALESARLEGATSWIRLSRIAVASNRLPLFGCWLLILAFCFGELSASQLAIPPGMDTIPRRMLGLLHAGVNNETAGLTIVVFMFITSVCLSGWASVRWFRRDHRP